MWIALVVAPLVALVIIIVAVRIICGKSSCSTVDAKGNDAINTARKDVSPSADG